MANFARNMYLVIAKATNNILILQKALTSVINMHEQFLHSVRGGRPRVACLRNGASSEQTMATDDMLMQINIL